MQARQYRLVIQATMFEPKAALRKLFDPPKAETPLERGLAAAYRANPPLLVTSHEGVGEAVSAGKGGIPLVGIIWQSSVAQLNVWLRDNLVFVHCSPNSMRRSFASSRSSIWMMWCRKPLRSSISQTQGLMDLCRLISQWHRRRIFMSQA